MKVHESPDFNAIAPEKFNWQTLDSVSMSQLGIVFAARIHGESLLIPSQRHATPGLRFALNEIAKIASL